MVNAIGEVIEYENTEIVDKNIDTQTDDVNHGKSSNTSRASILFFKCPEVIGKISKNGSTDKA